MGRVIKRGGGLSIFIRIHVFIKEFGYLWSLLDFSTVGLMRDNTCMLTM